MLPLPPGGLSELFRDAAIGAAVSGLLAVERKGALQLMLSRPLVAGTLLGFLLGNPQDGAAAGALLELLFLGAVNLGGSVPPNETLLACALASALVPAGRALGHGADGPLMVLGLLALFPLTNVGRWLERRGEEQNSALARRALERAQAGDPGGLSLHLRGLAWPFLTSAVLCGLGTLGSPLLAWAGAALDRTPLGAGDSLFVLVGLGLAVSLRALREARAPKVALASALALGLLLAGVAP